MVSNVYLQTQGYPSVAAREFIYQLFLELKPLPIKWLYYSDYDCKHLCNFMMFNYLLKSTSTGSSPLENYSTFLASEKPDLAEAGLETVAVPTEIFQVLWIGQSGLCTSFIIRVTIEANTVAIQYGNQMRTWYMNLRMNTELERISESSPALQTCRRRRPETKTNGLGHGYGRRNLPRK